ncbi:MAG: BON domain-containing protein [Planctomycetota bacterium]
MVPTRQITPSSIHLDYPDDDVSRRVTLFLHSRHFPGFRKLAICVDRGIVTLTGAVQSYYEKQIALTSCLNVPGVLSLIDNVTVEYELRLDPQRNTKSTQFD